jgi:hypothetical protein
MTTYGKINIRESRFNLKNEISSSHTYQRKLKILHDFKLFLRNQTRNELLMIKQDQLNLNQGLTGIKDYEYAQELLID